MLRRQRRRSDRDVNLAVSVAKRLVARLPKGRTASYEQAWRLALTALRTSRVVETPRVIDALRAQFSPLLSSKKAK